MKTTALESHPFIFQVGYLHTGEFTTGRFAQQARQFSKTAGQEKFMMAVAGEHCGGE